MSDFGSSSVFDFIVVGAGAAGCVLANRLSADGTTRVLLLEAGPDNPPGEEHFAIRDPYPVSLNYPNFSWPALTAEVGADLGRGSPRFSRRYLQGFGIGGGSNIQGMVALRGLPIDYDQWKEGGATGWGWSDVLPYFRRLERDQDFNGTMHGQTGPIPIRRIKPHDWAPFAKAFADALLASGYPLILDLNAEFSEGVGPMPMSNLPDRRVSASMAYLDARTRSRSNLCILPNAHVERIKMEGRKATGVEALLPSGRQQFGAEHIIVSAGAINSPALLMRSGIGPGQHIRQRGIKVIQDVPGVGQHLMNHVGMGIATYLPRSAVQPPSQKGFGQSCFQFSSGIEGPEPDVFLGPINRTGWHALGRRIGAIGVEVHKTYSLGEVSLNMADPMGSPMVKFNLLSDPRDMARLSAGMVLCLRIFTDEHFASVRNEAFLPNARIVQSLGIQTAWNSLRASVIAKFFEMGPLRRGLLGKSKIDPNELLGDPDSLRQLILEHASPPHHVSCTCRMGQVVDPKAVVDSDCQVIGVDNLRVIDASVMPSLIRANTHIPVLMIAEKMADRILGSLRYR